MARHIYQGSSEDQNGTIIPSATISVFLAGTATAASIYTASAGGSPVNSVTSDSNGAFSFYVDDTDYISSQLFKITLTKTGFSSQTFDDIDIIEHSSIIQDTSGNLGIGGVTPVSALTLPQEDDAITPTLSFGDGDTGFYENADDSITFSSLGVARLHLTTDGFQANSATGPRIRNLATTSTTPVFCPNKADTDTGIGSAAADQLSLIAGGSEAFRVDSNGLYNSTTNAAYISSSASTSSVPAFTFNGDTDTGISRSGTNELGFVAGGGLKAFLTSDGYFITRAGSSGGWASVQGVLLTDSLSTTSTTGTAEEVLDSTNIDANTLDQNNRGVRITAWGTTAANANSKTVKIRFGSTTLNGTVICTGTTTTASESWYVEAEVYRDGSSTQRSVSKGQIGTTNLAVLIDTTLAETDTAQILVEVTGTTPTASGDMTITGFKLEFLEAG